MTTPLDPPPPTFPLSNQALIELLRHLKRSYWPFAWDTSVDTQHCSHGGFRGAAKSALGSEEVTAEVRARFGVPPSSPSLTHDKLLTSSKHA